VDDKDITVVVQGPVQSLPERAQDDGITQRCLASVRAHLPDAKIVLSTWQDQELDGLDYDELVINEDPGPNILGYTAAGEPRPQNTNRQIVSTVGGLRRVTSMYAMKLRADNYLTGNGFKDLQQRYVKRCDEFRILRERVVVTNTLSRRYYRGRRVAFFLSDFFDFGLTADVLNIWDLRLFDDFPFNASLKGAEQHEGAPWPTLDVDQFLARGFINKNREQSLAIRHIFDTQDGLLRQSDVFFANNFVVATPDEIGLGLPLKFTQGRQAKASSQATCIASAEWQRLYREHCDRNYQPPTATLELLRLGILRLVFVSLKAFGNVYRLLREGLRFRRVTGRSN
jgi:hypothetical protein